MYVSSCVIVWFFFQYDGKMVRPGTTITFPRVIREVVRERFFDDEAGKYDDQYSNSDEVWYQIVSVGTVNLSGAVDLLWNTFTSACGYALPNSFSYIYSITCTDKKWDKPYTHKAEQWRPQSNHKITNLLVGSWRREFFTAEIIVVISSLAHSIPQ